MIKKINLSLNNMTKMDKQRILNLIKHRRKHMGFSQKDMADKLEITQTQYGKYELGRSEIGLDKLIEINKLLSITFSEYDDEETNNDITNDVIENLENCIQVLKSLK